ncbi:MAG: tetratricopeptide repeat protein [Cyclobacteriaceae bacterium]
MSHNILASGLANQLLDSTKFHIDKKEWVLAKEFCDKAYIESSNKNYSQGIVRATLYNGWIEQNAGDLALAVRKYLEVQSLTEISNDSTMLQNRAYASVNLGTLFRRHELFDLAVDNFYIALSAAQLLENSNQQLGILINIQRALRNAKDYGASIEVNQLVLKEAPRFSESNMMALNGLGIAHQLQGNYDLAKYYYLKLYDEATTADALNYKAFALHNLGDILYDQLAYLKAAEFYLQAIEAKSIDPKADVKDKHTSHRDIAKAYAKLNMLDEAIYHGEIAEQYLLQVDNCLECEVKLYAVLGDLMKTQGDQTSQTYYSRKLAIASEKFANEQLEITYESKQPELREVVNGYYADLRSQQEAKASRTLLVSVIIGFVALILVLGAYHFYSRMRVRSTLSAELEKLNWDN